MQSAVQKTSEQLPHLREPSQNGFSNDQIHSSIYEHHFIPPTISTNEKHTNYHHSHPYHHHHHHIQVEPKNTFRRISSPVKHQQIVDVQPNIIVQHQRSALGSNSLVNLVQSSTKDPFNEAYLERENTGLPLLTTVNTHRTNDNDTTLTLKQSENQHERRKTSMTPPPSPATQELNRIWKKQKGKYPIRSATLNLTGRKNSKGNRPPGRLKNYEDETNSETTATETQSKDGGT